MVMLCFGRLIVVPMGLGCLFWDYGLMWILFVENGSSTQDVF